MCSLLVRPTPVAKARLPESESTRKLRSGKVSENRLGLSVTMHVYEVRPRKDHRGFDLISDVLPFGRLWYGEQNAVSNAIDYAMHYSRSHDAVIRVYDADGNVIEMHQHARQF